MTQRLLFLSLLVICGLGFTSADGNSTTTVKYTGFVVYQIIPKTEDDLKVVEKITNLDGVDTWTSVKLVNFSTIVMISPKLQEPDSEFMKLLTENHLHYEILIENVQKSIENERFFQETARMDYANFEGSGISFTHYPRHQQVVDYLQSLADKYPKYVKVFDIGKSYEGRPLKVIKISSTPQSKKIKPSFIVDGGFHAREWIGVPTVLYIIHQLVENSSAYYQLFDKVDWYILPIMNPDGYEYTHKRDRMWRKTRRPNYNPSCPGTDPNRNFDYQWMECGASQQQCSESYAGPRSFSESETRALRDFGLTLKNNVLLYLSFHSFGQMFLYPDNYDAQLYPLAEKVNDAFQRYKYKIGSPSNILYCAAGGSFQWFKAVVGAKYSYTIELPGGGFYGFDLPPYRIIDVVTDVFLGVRVFGEHFRDVKLVQ